MFHRFTLSPISQGVQWHLYVMEGGDNSARPFLAAKSQLRHIFCNIGVRGPSVTIENTNSDNIVFIGAMREWLKKEGQGPIPFLDASASQ